MPIRKIPLDEEFVYEDPWGKTSSGQFRDWTKQYCKALEYFVGLAESFVSTGDDSDECLYPLIALNLWEEFRRVLIDLERLSFRRAVMPTGPDGKVPSVVAPSISAAVMAYSEAMRPVRARWAWEASWWEDQPSGDRWIGFIPAEHPKNLGYYSIRPSELAMLQLAGRLAKLPGYTGGKVSPKRILEPAWTDWTTYGALLEKTGRLATQPGKPLEALDARGVIKLESKPRGKGKKTPLWRMQVLRPRELKPRKQKRQPKL